MDVNALAQEVTEMHADLCSALADPKRILMIYALAEQRLNVSELAMKVGTSQPAASRHLKILRERGLVSPEREGSSVRYKLLDLRLVDALDILRSVLRERLQYRASLLEAVE